MASSLMCPSSPNSLRLRLGFRCRDSSSSFLRVRFRPSNRRLVVSSVAGESEGGGGAGWAWNVSDASLDAFAGWSDAGSGAEESKKKKGIRDVMGLTLVGSLFAAGVAFTTLVYINKNLSGTKNRVDPSKEFTTSYDTRTEGDQVSNDFDVILTEKDGMTSNFHEDNETVQQVLPGKVLVPAIIDQVQGQALAALQVLKIIEVDAQQGDICSRREYARWLVSASNVFARSAFSKVYPAMYIENVTELAFDDVTPEDPDFPSIQGLAEAGLISSKLSKQGSVNKCDDCNLFSPEW